ncbi:acyl-CoA dehydrogenase [Salipaludibacillus keqinensis]|uniref:Acyl-CoA dehydrogenase n=2 Tax=Salipaludibacillus keqinensis TaxID=2045207 RepID=A0A323TEA9_9BACI|nr:acyl-CoA dehydrogenase family protein [Salipaludibacillus keqinensis]PYZ92137.1 acyl-CoA dehydrogenase [Salipaludibacillus keqinensis]
MNKLDDLLKDQLKPVVKQVDEKAYYPREVLLAIGKAGYLSSQGKSLNGAAAEEIEVVKRTSAYCMTTGFNLWCHLAALTYLRHTPNNELRDRLLPKLENGEVLGGTGLSNPMKYYAGLESLHLKAAKTKGGYVLSGVLPAVSNLGSDHWFGVIGETEEDQRVMFLVSCKQEGLTLKEKVSYLGINGSATYACNFNEVFIPNDQILSDDADSFVKQIRPYFVAYQIPLGLGVTSAAIASINKHCHKQGGCNEFLPVQVDDISDRLEKIEHAIQQVFKEPSKNVTWELMLPIRRDVAYLTLDAVHTAMLHAGGSAYLKNSADARRLRETYFLANLTPTVKHLEKMLTGFSK